MYTYIIRLVIVVRLIASQTSLWGSPTWGFDYQLLIFLLIYEESYSSAA